MRLSNQEFKAMNTAFRRFIQRKVEFPTFQRLGLTNNPGDLLEIGCGSGYGATLLLSLEPKSYAGVDLMPEQIALAQQRELAGAHFSVQDASDLKCCADESKDTVVIFGVLHHIPSWRQVVQECYRVLRTGGKLYVEEPDAGLLGPWERVFHWGHPDTDIFRLRELEAHMENCGFSITQRRYLFGFGIYAARK
ncbi:MAG: class I SAM-dependent methyltransferase [Chloroflexota bacterium]